MTDDPTAPNDQASSSPFSDQAFDQDGPGTQNWGEQSDSDMDGSSLGDRSAFVFEMTKMWIREHQTASMLGAFAVGVFIGSYLRD